jgi:hypothetical protein
MKLEMSKFQAVAANLAVEGDVCDLATPTEAVPEIVSFIQDVGATSIEEMDRLMAEVQAAREFLQSEGKRVEQETVRYANLAQMASVTTKIIIDAISQWHPAHNPKKSSISEVKPASTDDSAL